MHPEMRPETHDAPTSYQIYAEKPRETRHGKVIALAVIAVLVVANVTSAALYQGRLNQVTGLQQTQIHQLDQANSRLASQLSAQSTQLSQMSAKLAAANPASDSSLITCRDLKNMALAATNGGSVSSVPGSVSLSQSAVPLPGHCRKLSHH